MKNKSIVLIYIFLIAFITVSCDNSNKKNSLIEPELFNDFTLIDASNQASFNTNRNVGVGTVWTIGRKSKNCHRLGICKLDKIIINVNKSQRVLEDNEVFSNIVFYNGSPFIISMLDRELDPTIYDTNLYIDEDLIDEDLLVNQAIIPLDNSIGSYGGYLIPLNITE